MRTSSAHSRRCLSAAVNRRSGWPGGTTVWTPRISMEVIEHLWSNHVKSPFGTLPMRR